MARTDTRKSSRPGRRDAPADDGSYWERSRRPLEILVFLAPFIVVYELGLLAALRTREGVLTNQAHGALLRFFDLVGMRGEAVGLPALSLPAAALVAVLISWQVISRRAWVVHLPTLPLMAVEAAAAALPLVVLGRLVAWIPALGTPPDQQVRSLGLGGQLAVAVGAGLYEELVFRMLAIAVVHALVRDLMRVPERWAVPISIVVPAILFCLYHPLSGQGAPASARAIFFLGAGLWWGTVYVVRGFGIAVGSHAAYDAVALLLPPGAFSG